MSARITGSSSTSRSRRSAGFSLVEVLVALVVISIGLLGLAKMEALAVSSTTIASARSIAAIQAASMAAMMHANPDYWQSSFVAASATINSAAGGNPAPTPATCNTTGAAACNNIALANYDVYQWGVALAQVLPNYAASITCGQAAGQPNAPYTCVILINWAENAVAMDKNQTMANMSGPTYTMYVQP